MKRSDDKQPDFATYGRKGALVRARRLSPEQRQEIARKAALTRHKRTPKNQRQEAARKAVRARWKAYRAKMTAH